MASTVTKLVTTTVLKASVSPTAKSRAVAQGGILEGANPSKYDPKNPIVVFIIQAGIIIIFCRILHWPLGKLRQPRVIAEIIGGILLGPSVMGRIPGFTTHIFPTASMPVLNAAANLGLILFLFLVGLEVDLRLLLKNWRIALSVGAAGMAIPFGLGCGIAWGLYHEFRSDAGIVPISFGTYMLFIGVAMAITAFPVLCRILTELKLLQNQVGVVVLSAGVGNDVVGWILLALCVALVNAGSGLTALWVLLVSVAYVLLLVYGIRPGFLWILRRTGSIQNGPTQSVVALTILMVLASSFFTGIIGVHPIFGAFLVGLICPHDGGFAIKLTEKLEDLVTVFFLPLYFALSGLSTNIGLLNNGTTWGYVVGVIAIAFFGKIAGGTLAARANKLLWRESFTIGVLMSCKGLVELIVLNIGLQAKILSTRTFTIFVVMALVTTFATTPLTQVLYPPWYQKKLIAWRRGEIDWDGNRLDPTESSDDGHTLSLEKEGSADIRRLMVYLRLDSLPSLFTFVSLLGGDKAAPVQKVHPEKAGKSASQGLSGSDQAALKSHKRPLEVHGVRMVELTERLSSVMKDSELDDYSHRDPVVNAFHTFGQLNNVAVSGEVEVVPEGSFAEVLAGRAASQLSDLVLLFWSETGSISEAGHPSFDNSTSDRFSSGPHNEFVSNFLTRAPCNAAVFVNKGFGAVARDEQRLMSRPAFGRSNTGLSIRSGHGVPISPLADLSHHIFLPFFGGADDRVALRFVLRLAQNTNITATILYVGLKEQPSDVQSSSAPEVVDASAKKETKVATTTVRDASDNALFNTLKDSLPREMESRVVFGTLETSQPLRDTVERARSEVGQSPNNAGDIVVVGRTKDGKTGLRQELQALLVTMGQSSAAGTETRESLGDLAEAMIVGNVKASVLVFQAKGKGLQT